ncbi:MBL fold metallo-hydrolase [Amycolatopsis albispora]|uniref:MBL fold metallo-hydrolase n=1 Tax=Amycolatopsis albispora TaxID=1804986 RepID=A0A344L8Z7_9PSEU|nr:MBL fold metallo-hydrolase [Amycolatopsis albispora]AXB44521.1 MBL fold metallo-hydrolase [Amycolatopsis albispora]
MELSPDDGSRHWAEPGVYAVSPGVYRIPLPLPNDALKAINVYAVTDGSRLVLIDSGWALVEARELLGAGLKAIGAELGDIAEFLVTHVHRDHYTQAVALRREFGGRVALGDGERESLKISGDPTTMPMNTQIRLLTQAGATPVIEALAAMFGNYQRPRTDTELWEEPDEWLTPGRRTVLPDRELDVVHTPGHTAGHLVFVDEAADLMFTGDHVLPHITPSIGFQPARSDLPLKEFLDSLRLVRGMPDRRMLPAHGPVSPSVHTRVDELLVHHDKRLDEIGTRVAEGASTAYEVALRLGWTRRQRELGELDAFNQCLAVNETGAHLDLLAFRGALRVSDVDGIRHYLLP